MVTTFNLEQRKLLKQTIIQLCDHKNLICDRLFAGHMLQKNGTMTFKSAIDHSLVSRIHSFREKVFSDASLMMIMTMMHNWCIIQYFLTKAARCYHNSRRKRHNPVTLDTKIGKDFGFYCCCPLWHWRENIIMESNQWEGFLCQDDQSGYRETSTLAHTSQVTLCSQFTRCVTELVLIHTLTQSNPLRV